MLQGWRTGTSRLTGTHTRAKQRWWPQFDTWRYAFFKCRYKWNKQPYIKQTATPPPTAPLYRILLPALLPGARCYTDASTAPDHSHMVFLQALMTSTTSVLMAEAAALDLAASMVSLLNLQSPSYLTDNQQLVTFFNGSDLSTPPDWAVKPFTQSFINRNVAGTYRVFKIARQQNQTAHLLARIHSHENRQSVSITCSNQSHVNRCPLREALTHVQWEYFSPII